MESYRIAVVVGSLRKDSFNRMMANAVVKLAPSDFSFKQVQIGDLPLYNQDDDAELPPLLCSRRICSASACGTNFGYPDPVNPLMPTL